MALELGPDPLPEGTVIPGAELDAPDLLTGVVEFIGMPMHKDIALIVVAAGCFFLGVVISCLMPEVKPGQRRRTLLSAPMTFLLTSPIWFTLLSGDLIRTSIAPIDSFLAFAMGSGGVRAQMFAFGVVMVIGLLAAPILQGISNLFQKILQVAGGKASGDQGATPPASSPLQLCTDGLRGWRLVHGSAILR